MPANPVDPVAVVVDNQVLLFRNKSLARDRMLRLFGNRKVLCDGISRRDLLHIGGLCAFCVALDHFLRVQRIQAAPATGPPPPVRPAKSPLLIFQYPFPPPPPTFHPQPP